MQTSALPTSVSRISMVGSFFATGIIRHSLLRFVLVVDDQWPASPALHRPRSYTEFSRRLGALLVIYECLRDVQNGARGPRIGRVAPARRSTLAYNECAAADARAAQ